MADYSAQKLIGAITRLPDFLESAELPANGGWPQILGDIRNGLTAAVSREEALEKLERCFRSMGSLNDYMFHADNGNVPAGKNAHVLNRELERLLDRCYMEFRLLNMPWSARLAWR